MMGRISVTVAFLNAHGQASKDLVHQAGSIMEVRLPDADGNGSQPLASVEELELIEQVRPSCTAINRRFYNYKSYI
jgi:hypothetical protein